MHHHHGRVPVDAITSIVGELPDESGCDRTDTLTSHSPGRGDFSAARDVDRGAGFSYVPPCLLERRFIFRQAEAPTSTSLEVEAKEDWNCRWQLRPGKSRR
jgi:hypothetical protein